LFDIVVVICGTLLHVVVLEVYQFARDASVAEAWLMAHEPYLSSQEYGVRKMFLSGLISSI